MRARVALLVLTLVLAVSGAAPAFAQGDDTTTTPAPEAPSIIPEPNSGHAPTDAGDRGGALQTTLFVAMCAGVVVIVALAVRESRRRRAERGF